MLIQIHTLQNHAPSNLNRDDSGAPKDTIFGGVKRGRISSQCLKRSIRRSDTFAAAFAYRDLLAVRTKLLPKLIDEELQKLGADDTTRKNIVARVPEIGKKGSAKSEDEEEETTDAVADAVGETRQLIFLAANEVSPLTQKLVALYTEKGAKGFATLEIKKLEEALKHELPRSVDIAMFGRMTTSDAFENVEAAVQVAHAISTNALVQEFDYFTAVDDISGQSGAGMIGDVEFNSSTYYKYFNIHWEELCKNLGNDTAVAQEAVLAFLEAAALTQPSGKQNSFAAHNLPDLILVEVSTRNLPVSYANAFLKPARQRYDQSMMDVSIEELNRYTQRLRKTFGLNGKRAFITTTEAALGETEQLDSLPALQSWLKTQLTSE